MVSVRALVSDVRLVGIKKSFGDNVIVKGVDLAVTPGEFLVMVGPSGSWARGFHVMRYVG